VVASTGLVALVAFAALGALAYSAVAVSTDAVRSEAKREVGASAQASAVAVSDELGGLADVVESYARRPRLVAEIGNGDPVSINHAGLHVDLDELQHARSNIDLAFVADNAGRLLDILPATPSIVGKSFAYRDWYQGVTRTNAPYISAAYRTAATGHALVVAAAAPIFASDSTQRVGILVVGYDLDTIQSYVDHFSSAQGVAITVTDQTGTEIATPGHAPTTLISLRSDAQVSAALTGRTLITNRSANTGAAISASVPIPDLGWALIAQVPMRTVLAQTNTLRRTVTIIGAFLAAIVALGVLVLFRSARRQARADRELRRNETALRASEQGLSIARDTAERANQAKSEFLSRMSHELRTPLNSILGFAQLLETEPLDDEQHDNVTQIHRAGRHLLELINEVLDISRIEAGRLAVSIEPVNLAGVIAEALDLIRPLAAGRTIDLPARIPEACEVFVSADRHRLRQILVNLLANAVKYNREHGRVDLNCTITDGRVRLAISDTGAGISSEKQALLFTPFERLGAEQTDVEGTGLGLALTYRLVHALGGTIGCQSHPGTGSTFWVEFAAATPPATPHAALTPAVASEPTDGAARTVLYIEDNPANIKLVQRILTRRPNITLLTAHEGAPGIMLATTEHPDLILLDLHLPDMTGELVLQRLKADPSTHEIPVIVISADATPAQTDRLRATGAHDYMTKPFDIDALLQAVDSTTQPAITSVPNP